MGRTLRWIVVLVPLVIGVAAWGLLGPASPAPETDAPMKMRLSPAQKRVDVAERLGTRSLDGIERRRSRTLGRALRAHREDVGQCLGLLRADEEYAELEQVELTATYTVRDDDGFSVAVIAPEVGNVTFDRCINAVLEPLTIASDEEGTATLDLADDE